MDQFGEARAGEFAVLRLAAGGVDLDDDRAVFGPFLTGQFAQARFDMGGDVWAALGLEP